MIIVKNIVHSSNVPQDYYIQNNKVKQTKG